MAELIRDEEENSDCHQNFAIYSPSEAWSKILQKRMRPTFLQNGPHASSITFMCIHRIRKQNKNLGQTVVKEQN